MLSISQKKLSFGWSKFECLLELRTDSCRLVGPPAEKSMSWQLLKAFANYQNSTVHGVPFGSPPCCYTFILLGAQSRLLFIKTLTNCPACYTGLGQDQNSQSFIPFS